MAPLVVALRRFALDDGPGIRTTVFLKGCPLRCTWCHNPEAMSPGPEVAFEAARCVECGACARTCPAEAITGRSAGRVDRRRCDGCGRCAAACPSTALRRVGEEMSAGALVAALLRDRVFYETSGGGVTFSGGEPTMHLAFVAEVARALRREGVHVALQTCGLFDLAAFRAQLLPWLDLVQFDLKLAHPAMHRRHTGRGNARIVRNFLALARETPSRVVPRVPLVPGVTDAPGNLAALARLVRASGCERHALLPFNPGAHAKREALGQAAPACIPARPLRRAEEDAARRAFAAAAAVRSTLAPQGGPP
ncbi:MAG TPA: glycyl-radical enzyme activating protein [Anaeromyxobacteraceae bacterium]|nr:glycyl-radical enzyme activating protein [Anaeromyxobacteraceae bacterium]